MDEDLKALKNSAKESEQLHLNTVSEKDTKIQSLTDEIRDLKESHSAQMKEITDGNSATETLQ